MTRPDLPVAAWPTADHSVGASVFRFGLSDELDGWDGELLESAGAGGLSVYRESSELGKRWEESSTNRSD
jgi:hypothetical protein